MEGMKRREESVDPIIEVLRRLPASDQSIISTLIKSMAERAGIPIIDAGRIEAEPAIEYIGLWLTSLKARRLSPRTIYVYEWAVRHFLTQDAAPTTQSIRTYLAARLDAGVSAHHVGLERKALASFFNFLEEEGIIGANPMRRIKPIAIPFRQPELPAEDGIRALLSANFTRPEDQARFRLMVTLLIDTGLRVSEGVGILKTNIDPQRPAITVIGKGNKERMVPISFITMGMISEFLELYDKPENPYLFPSLIKVSDHWHFTNVERTMLNTCDRLGIDRIHPHQLRHFYATAMLKNGAKLEVVSRLLGHASVGITGDLYRHVDAEEMDEQHRTHGPLNGLNGEA